MFSVKKRKKGLTLIETIISFTILSIVSIPMFSIIMSSVKSNKLGEDKQKTLYVAQKYAETFKSKDIDKSKLGQVQLFKGTEVPEENKDLDIPQGYFVNVVVEPLTGYKFADVDINTANNDGSTSSSSSSTNSGYTSIQYDTKIIISKNTTGPDIVANMEIDSTDGSKYTYPLKTNYKLEISNGSDNGSNALVINLKDDNGIGVNVDSLTINKTPLTNNNSNVIIQMDANEKDEPTANLNIDFYNKIDGSDMTVYLAKVKDTTLSDSYNNDVIKCSLKNQQGKVNIYSNIYDKSDTTNVYSDGDTRVYKITIRLFKDGQNTDAISGDKPINQVITYKNVLQ